MSYKVKIPIIVHYNATVHTEENGSRLEWGEPEPVELPENAAFILRLALAYDKPLERL